MFVAERVQTRGLLIGRLDSEEPTHACYRFGRRFFAGREGSQKGTGSTFGYWWNNLYHMRFTKGLLLIV